MTDIQERYADLIIRYALRLQRGDILSINTDEESGEMAHLISAKAKEITGNGSYIQYIENGKVTEKEEADSDYPIQRTPTALLHLPLHQRRKRGDISAGLPFRDIQEYRHLADPLELRRPSIPFVSAPIPSENCDPLSFIEALYDIDAEELIDSECSLLNSYEMRSCRITDENGTDLSFSFLEGTRFFSEILELEDGRRFIPSIFPGTISRIIDSDTVSGYITSSLPFMFFGEEESHITLHYERGALKDYSADFPFEWYLQQDGNASRISELVLADMKDSELSGVPEWDRLRGASVILGGPHPESLVTEDALSKANQAAVYLALPFSTEDTEIIAIDKDGDEVLLFSDGMIKER